MVSASANIFQVATEVHVANTQSVRIQRFLIVFPAIIGCMLPNLVANFNNKVTVQCLGNLVWSGFAVLFLGYHNNVYCLHVSNFLFLLHDKILFLYIKKTNIIKWNTPQILFGPTLIT